MIAILLLSLWTWAEPTKIVVGSKAFTESYILANRAVDEIALVPDVRVQSRLGIGGTGLVVQALQSGEIDVYPEYTGTIAQVILKKPELVKFDEIQAELKKIGLQMTRPLGFNNTYAIALSPDAIEKFKIKKLSELKAAPSIRLGFSQEFYSRADGYPLLLEKLRWQPTVPPIVMSHELAYNAISSGKIDAMDVYSTDANVDSLKLTLLQDDLHITPKYQAVFLVRTQFIEKCPACWKRLDALAGKFSEQEMRRLNANGITNKKELFDHRLSRRVKEHLILVSIAFCFSLLIGVPLGFLGFHYRRIGHVILGLSGLIQTVPSLALFCLLIPFLGIGPIPAVVALCLYALLPVVAGTVLGLRGIDPLLFEVAETLCLSPRQKLIRLELPLASLSIWSGLKTSTIITIGTATLAALIGAGGLGAPIVEGLALNDMNLVLMGAIPSAVLALITHFLFDWLELIVVPKGLQL